MVVLKRTWQRGETANLVRTGTSNQWRVHIRDRQVQQRFEEVTGDFFKKWNVVLFALFTLNLYLLTLQGNKAFLKKILIYYIIMRWEEKAQNRERKLPNLYDDNIEAFISCFHSWPLSLLVVFLMRTGWKSYILHLLRHILKFSNVCLTCVSVLEKKKKQIISMWHCFFFLTKHFIFPFDEFNQWTQDVSYFLLHCEVPPTEEQLNMFNTEQS